MLRKMITQLSLVLALFGGLAFTAFQTPVAHAQTASMPPIRCQTFDEGKVSIKLTGNVTLIAVRFDPQFCETPYVWVIKSPLGHSTPVIKVHWVTTKVAWFVIYGTEGQKVDFSWRATMLFR